MRCLFFLPKGFGYFIALKEKSRTQLLNDGRQIFKGVIDFSVRRIPGQRETDGAMREGEGTPIARSTCEGSRLPEVQAEPELAQMPS